MSAMRRARKRRQRTRVEYWIIIGIAALLWAIILFFGGFSFAAEPMPIQSFEEAANVEGMSRLACFDSDATGFIVDFERNGGHYRLVLNVQGKKFILMNQTWVWFGRWEQDGKVLIQEETMSIDAAVEKYPTGCEFLNQVGS